MQLVGISMAIHESYFITSDKADSIFHFLQSPAFLLVLYSWCWNRRLCGYRFDSLRGQYRPCCLQSYSYAMPCTNEVQERRSYGQPHHRTALNLICRVQSPRLLAVVVHISYELALVGWKIRAREFGVHKTLSMIFVTDPLWIKNHTRVLTADLYLPWSCTTMPST